MAERSHRKVGHQKPELNVLDGNLAKDDSEGVCKNLGGNADRSLQSHWLDG